jgi:hypothetical protein
MPRNSLARSPRENRDVTNQLVGMWKSLHTGEQALVYTGFKLESQVSMPFVEFVCEFPYRMDEVNEK